MMRFYLLILTVGLAFNDVFCFPDFYLFNRMNPGGILKVDAAGVKKAIQAGGHCYDEIYFIVHGFQGGSTDEWMHIMKDALLETSSNKCRTVFIVGWEGGSGTKVTQYLSAAKNAVQVVGKRIATFIQESGINPKKVHCIGHSLGAQACGSAGRTIKLKRISGLDPAAPKFEKTGSLVMTVIGYETMLSKNDADFVDIIHTNIKTLGTQQEIGHVDFYPNGGMRQPGCPLVQVVHTKKKRGTQIGCNHGKAYWYFINSIRTPYDPALTARRSDLYGNAWSLKQFIDLFGKCDCYVDPKSSCDCQQMGFGAKNPGTPGSYVLSYSSNP